MPRGTDTKASRHERRVPAVHLRRAFTGDDVVGDVRGVVQTLRLILIELDERAARVAAAGDDRVTARLVAADELTLDHLHDGQRARLADRADRRRRRSSAVLAPGRGGGGSGAACSDVQRDVEVRNLSGPQDHFLLERHDLGRR